MLRAVYGKKGWLAFTGPLLFVPSHFNFLSIRERGEYGLWRSRGQSEDHLNLVTPASARAKDKVDEGDRDFDDEQECDCHFQPNLALRVK